MAASSKTRSGRTSDQAIAVVLIVLMVAGGAFLSSYDYWYMSSRLEEAILTNSSKLVMENRVGQVRLTILDREGHVQPAEHVLIDPVSLDFILGAGVWTTTASVGWTQDDWKLYRDIGFEYEQIWTTWRLIEPQRLAFDFSSVRGQLDYVRSNNPHAKFFARLQGIVPDPLVAGSLQDAAPPDFVGFSSKIPFDRSEYLRDLGVYVRALVSEYRNDIKLWITPIEINRIDYAISAFNLTDRPWTLEDAIEIDRIIAEAIRESDPEATIALGASPPLSSLELPDRNRVDPIEFERLAIKAGVPFDVVAVEAYGFSGDALYWAQYLRAMSGLGRPIFINEAGFSSRSGDYSTTERAIQEQSTWFRTMLALSLSSKSIVGFWVLEFKDRELPGRFSQFEGMGLLDSTGMPKESYRSIMQLLSNITRPNDLVSSEKGEVAIRVLGGTYRVRVLNATGEMQVVENETKLYVVQATGGSDLTVTTIQSLPRLALCNDFQGDQRNAVSTSAYIEAHQTRLINSQERFGF